MIIETKTRTAQTERAWKHTNVLRLYHDRPHYLKLRIWDDAVFKGADMRLWRINGVRYETRMTENPGNVVYIAPID